jgi:DNA replication and repair protein RecF
MAAALGPRVAEHFRALHADLPVTLHYRSDPAIELAPDEEGVRAALSTGLADRRALDERRRFTGFGPQADDLEVGLSGSLARTHASQGQLRSLMLSLKLAELTEVSARLGDPPILLLDDVPSELDPSRRALLFEVITKLDCQTLISVTEREIVPARTDRLDFQVRAGRVSAVA